MGKYQKVRIQSVINEAQQTLQSLKTHKAGKSAIRAQEELIEDLFAAKELGLMFVRQSDPASAKARYNEAYADISSFVVGAIRSESFIGQTERLFGLYARIMNNMAVQDNSKPDRFLGKSFANIHVATAYYNQLARREQNKSTKAVYREKLVFLKEMNDIGWKNVGFLTDVDGYPVQTYAEKIDVLYAANHCAKEVMNVGGVDKLVSGFNAILSRHEDMVLAIVKKRQDFLRKQEKQAEPPKVHACYYMAQRSQAASANAT